MQTEHFTLKGNDELNIFVYKWCPEVSFPVKGIVQILHGMGEHAARYQAFAKALTEEGYIVYASDHRGHGKTAVNQENLGHLDVENGWDSMVGDIYKLTTIIKNENPKVPLFILGHSMGSFILRQLLYKYKLEIHGAILSGIGLPSNLELNFGILAARTEIKKYGAHHNSHFINKLTFGLHNRKIAFSKTSFDWLTRDEAEVDKYNKDNFCGTVCTSGFFFNLFNGIKELQKPINVDKIPKNIPVLIASGEKDPVGNYGRAVLKLANQYKKAGIRDVTFKLYKQCRHEILNELNKNEVYSDIIQWLDMHIISR